VRRTALQAHLLTDHPGVFFGGQDDLDEAFGRVNAAPAPAPPRAAPAPAAAAAAGPGQLLVRIRLNTSDYTCTVARTATVGQLRQAVQAAVGVAPNLMTGGGVAIFAGTDASRRIDQMFSPAYLASGDMNLTITAAA
jgi:hypothetical protein